MFFFLNLKSRVEKVIKGLSCRDQECQLCKKSYSSTQHLRNHLRKKHLGKTPHKCNICNKVYTDSSTLKDHMKHHDAAARKFKCSKCPKEYFSKSKLKAHEPVHQGKTFHCPYCTRSYNYLKGLREHQGKCDKNPSYDPEDKFRCRFCQKGYKQKKSLLRHMRNVNHKSKK